MDHREQGDDQVKPKRKVVFNEKVQVKFIAERNKKSGMKMVSDDQFELDLQDESDEEVQAVSQLLLLWVAVTTFFHTAEKGSIQAVHVQGNEKEKEKDEEKKREITDGKKGGGGRRDGRIL